MPYKDNQLSAPTKAIAERSIKSLRSELSNLTPSSLVTLIEIDLSSLLSTKQIENLSTDAKTVGFKSNLTDATLRFHNNVKIINSHIVWRRKTYYPAPIITEGFEASTKGTLPQPTLSIASQSESGIDQIALLKHEIRKFGDIIGAKVTRRRTFAKYLDYANFLESNTNTNAQVNKAAIGQQLPVGYEPDPYAELPSDVFFIERKVSENKNIIKYQLSSVLDLEGIKLPKRVVVADKCMWQYRGCGCWYQHADTSEITGKSNGSDVPVLKKAGLKKLPTTGQGKGVGLPSMAPPVADDNDELISEIINTPVTAARTRATISQLAKWNADQDSDTNDIVYAVGSVVYLEKDDIKYYYVAKKNITKEENVANPPPNTNFWVADECSKTLTGCRLRWGINATAGVINSDPEQACDIVKGKLPFGGFPAARKVQNQQ